MRHDAPLQSRALGSRACGQGPLYFRLRAELRACIDGGPAWVNKAKQLIAEMVSAGCRPSMADHRVVVAAMSFEGRSAEAETYLRRLRMQRPWAVTAADIEPVLFGHALRQDTGSVERVHEEARDWLPARALPALHEALLAQLLICDPRGVIRWHARFEREGVVLSAAGIVTVIEALGDCHRLDALRRLYAAMSEERPEVLVNLRVASAFTDAFADAGDVEMAKRVAEKALAHLHPDRSTRLNGFTGYRNRHSGSSQ